MQKFAALFIILFSVQTGLPFQVNIIPTLDSGQHTVLVLQDVTNSNCKYGSKKNIGTLKEVDTNAPCRPGTVLTLNSMSLTEATSRQLQYLMPLSQHPTFAEILKFNQQYKLIESNVRQQYHKQDHAQLSPINTNSNCSGYNDEWLSWNPGGQEQILQEAYWQYVNCQNVNIYHTYTVLNKDNTQGSWGLCWTEEKYSYADWVLDDSLSQGGSVSFNPNSNSYHQGLYLVQYIQDSQQGLLPGCTDQYSVDMGPFI